MLWLPKVGGVLDDGNTDRNFNHPDPRGNRVYSDFSDARGREQLQVRHQLTPIGRDCTALRLG